MDRNDYNEIYRHQAEQYARLVACEDYLGNIFPTLREICELDGRVIVDTGAGTGRMIKLLAPHAAALLGFDISSAMLRVAHQELRQGAFENWVLVVADHGYLPLPANTADVIISGWSLCYLALDQPQPWRAPLRDVINRFRQILRPGGVIILLETQGTGYTTPHPPPFMGDYFAFLGELGFQAHWIRTDYEFGSLPEAEDLTRFFFGDELAHQVAESGSLILPECTGIWWMYR